MLSWLTISRASTNRSGAGAEFIASTTRAGEGVALRERWVKPVVLRGAATHVEPCGSATDVEAAFSSTGTVRAPAVNSNGRDTDALAADAYTGLTRLALIP